MELISWKWDFDKETAKEKPILISVISVVVFAACRLLVLLVTSHLWVMDRWHRDGLRKNNAVCFLWLQPAVERDCQVTCPPTSATCLPQLRRRFTAALIVGVICLRSLFATTGKKPRRRSCEGFKELSLLFSFSLINQHEAGYSCAYISTYTHVTCYPGLHLRETDQAGNGKFLLFFRSASPPKYHLMAGSLFFS